MLFSDKYADVAARFINWLGNNNSGNSRVSNLALDYLNRAQDSIAQEAPRGWIYLTKDYVVMTKIPDTGSGVGGPSGLEYGLPADCGVPLCIYVDTNGTGKPTIYYSRNGTINFGGALYSQYNPATGHSLTFKFFYSPINTPYIRYQIQLARFTGVGDEYCAFPGDLLILEAQKIRCSEKGLIQEWNMLQSSYENFLEKFKEKNQNVMNVGQPPLNDGYGNPLLIPEYGLASGMKSRQIQGRRNDMDVTRY